MIDYRKIYSGLRYLETLNITYKSFNIDISPLPDINFQHHVINLSTIIPAHGKVQKHKKMWIPVFSKVMKDTKERNSFYANIKDIKKGGYIEPWPKQRRVN